MTGPTIRIANAGGYWGDDPTALRRQVLGPDRPDYVVIDYLAELTMSILQKQKERDPQAGYARDFVQQLGPLLEAVLERGVRIVTNAGGVNPRARAEALAAEARRRGLGLRIALVEGDDILARLAELKAAGAAFANLETLEPLPADAGVRAANAYFGARPVAAALALEPHVVLCGRVTDTGLTLGPLIHAFGWSATDWDRLAAGIVAGHILECGAQATGGNFTDWGKVEGFEAIGFPVAEAAADGSFVITKQPGSGGLVSCATVREQLLYEMGDPRAYLTPDVVADFSGIRLEPDGAHRVRVSGVRGGPPTDQLKVSIAHADGWKVSGALLVSGPDARAKAQALERMFWRRCRAEWQLAGLAEPARLGCERVGDDACHPGSNPDRRPGEILLRLSARDARKEPLEVFRKLLPALILSGPPGVAVTGGAPAVTEVVGYWPALVPRGLVPATVRLLELPAQGGALREGPVRGPLPWPDTPGPATPPPVLDPHPPFPDAGPRVRVPLLAIAHARSGDKGDTANIGLIGRSAPCYAWLRDHLPANLVRDWFKELCRGPVTRHPVPGLWALNFLLAETLDGGGTRSLRLDAQGKTLAQGLLRARIEVPRALLDTIAPEQRPCPGELFDAQEDL